MKMALGGSPAEEPAPSTREERRAEIEAAEYTPGAFDYNTCSEYAAKLILQVVLANPQIDWVQLPTEARYSFDKGESTLVEGGWYEMLKELFTPEQQAQWDELGLSGFMWGWAVNTVRWLLDMPPVGNPAIVEINL